MGLGARVGPREAATGGLPSVLSVSVLSVSPVLTVLSSNHQAYRMRSLRYHPDRKGGSTASFQRIHQVRVRVGVRVRARVRVIPADTPG